MHMAAGRCSTKSARRRVVSEVERLGARVEIVPATEVVQYLDRLEAISNEWLERKSVREKGFSLGAFNREYLCRGPVAVVRVPKPAVDQCAAAPDVPDGGHADVVAFANLWLSGSQRTMSVDLMRFSEQAPRSTMDYLFIELMLWGKAEGYQQFNLGMAPLSGLDAHELAPLWAKAGAWLYRHGEHFYNYDGLRRYKEKFDPVWEPRYLASPGGLALPRILTNVASLISGGLAGIVRK
jgi:phosphatidylglycerol lysyltransferase